MFRSVLCAAVAAILPVVAVENRVSAAGAGLVAKSDNGIATITWNGKAVLTYRYGDAPPKPYVKELCTPGGTQILRDSPFDHVHHRGLMYGLFLNGADFWMETPEAGRQVNTEMKISTSAADPGLSRCRLEEKVQWILAGKTLADEQRTIDVWAGADLPATLLTWRLQLSPAKGVDKLTVTGSHYDGLGMRFLTTMDKVAKFQNATGKDGEVVRGTERVVKAKWCAVTSPPDKPVTVAAFDCPENVRQPAGMFTMSDPFTYLSATPNVWNNPLDLAQGEKLDLTYGVAVWDGAIDAAAIESLYARWLTLAKK
jgi:hypothetical protein